MKAFAVLLFLAAPPLAAQSTPPPATVHDEIIVTASALAEPVSSTPAAVTVITRQEIDERAARDIADVLREVPGVTVSRTGSPGRATSLFTRGSNSTHTLVLWNGIEINNPYFSGYDWGRFSTAGVGQVEVVRGPYSALYGSEAMAGVVNVRTDPSTSGFRGAVEFGGRGLRQAQAEGSWITGAHLLSGTIERRSDDGFAANDDFAQTTANALWRWKSASGLSLSLMARGTSYELGVPTNLNALGTALVPSLRRRQEGHERQVAAPLSWTAGPVTVDVVLSEVRRADDFLDPEDPYGLVSDEIDTRTRRANAKVRFQTQALGAFTVGGEWAEAAVDDLTNFGPNLSDEKRTHRSAFFEDRLSRSAGRGRIELAAGARYDDFDTFGSQLSPRASVAFVVGANKFRVGYGEAFRAPSVGELYFPFSGNRLLDPERSRSIEAGADRSIGSRSSVSFTLFRADYEDLIVFDNASFRFGNVGSAETKGLEIGGSHAFGNLRLAASYTHLEKPLPRRPRDSGSLFLGYSAGSVHTNVTLLRSGERDDILPVFPFSRTSNEAYTTLDVNVQMHLDRWTPFVKIENATDTRYEEVLGYPSPGRRAVVGLRFGM